MSPSGRLKYLLYSFRNGDSTTCLGSLFQCLTTLSVKTHNVQSRSLVVPLTAVFSCPLLCYLGEGAGLHLDTASFQTFLLQRVKASSESPFLQAEDPLLPRVNECYSALQTTLAHFLATTF